MLANEFLDLGLTNEQVSNPRSNQCCPRAVSRGSLLHCMTGPGGTCSFPT
jgi:hypothetical protein